MEDIKLRLRISQLIARKFTSSITEAELEELNEWISDSNEIEYNKLVQELSGGQWKESYASFDIDKEWKRFEKKNISKTRRFIYAYMGYAAASIIPLMLGIMVFMYANYYMESKVLAEVHNIVPGEGQGILTLANGEKIILNSNQKDTVLLNKEFDIHRSNNTITFQDKKIAASKEKEVKYSTLSIPKKGEYSLVLADGTTVWLNSETELTFPTSFPKNTREVFLKGEAYFDVAKDKNKAFIVHVGNLSINVLGTSFNVEARAEMNEIRTTLVEGSVLMKEGKNSLHIKPNQQAVFNKANKELISKQVNTRKYVAWKNGMFCYEDETLENILKNLSYWYGAEIVFEDFTLKNNLFTVESKKYENISKILRMIEKTGKVKFDIRNNTIYVHK